MALFSIMIMIIYKIVIGERTRVKILEIQRKSKVSC